MRLMEALFRYDHAILTNSNNGQFGSADFWMEERDKEMKGRLMFKIVGRQLEVLDPFGGPQDQHAFEVLSLPAAF